MLSLRKIPALLFLALAASGNAYVGKWHTFTNSDRVTSLIAHQGYVYAGTQGGIRRIDPATLAEKTYSNLDGLLDCSIVGMAETSDGILWAVSKSGYLYSLSGSRWIASGQSYAAQQWAMKPRAVHAAGQYLFLGSEKGLTVFDAVHTVAKANLTRFADKLDLAVLSLLVRGDTLYVGTPQGVYKATVDFANPFSTKYRNLSDPTIWSLVALPPVTPARQYDFLAFVGSTLSTYGPGMLLQSPVHVEAFQGQAVVIGSKSFPAVRNTDAALLINGQLFLGGDAGLSISTNPSAGSPSLSALPNTSQVPESVVNLSVHSNQFWGQSPAGLYHLNPDNGIILSSANIAPYSPASPNTSILDRHLRNLKVDDNGDVYVGSWGGGLMRFRNGLPSGTWTGATDPCIIAVVPNYWVVYSVSNVGRKGLFFSLFKAENGGENQLVYLDKTTGRISCLDSNVAGGYPHAVHIFSDSLIGVGTDRGVNLYKMRDGPNAPILTSRGLWKTTGQANEVWSMSKDELGRPWLLVGDNLAYADSLDTLFKHGTTTLKSVVGFSGTNCFSLENDPAGSLWAGCGNGLYRIQPALEGVAKIERFGLTDGLVGLAISDVSVDPTNGHVWVATDRGISMLESSAQPPVTTLQTVQVYPNPFRPQHRFVIFDNLPRDATVRIHTAAGRVVRIFHPQDLTGNQAQWDGTNENGKAVAAGVYLFSVTSGTSVERGKVIVAR